MLTVYVDLLLCYNLAVHFCLLLSTAAIGMIKLQKGRILCGCVLGSLTSFMIFLELDAFSFLLLKAVTAILLLLVSFGYGGMLLFLKRMLLFLAVNTVYAGAMMAVAFTFSPKGMIYQSGVAYFGGNTLYCVLGLLLGYLLIRVVAWARNRKKGAVFYPMTVVCGQKSIKVEALYDSGNLLTDVYTGMPVIVLSAHTAKMLLPEDVLLDMTEGNLSERVLQFGHQARLLPLTTVGGASMTVRFVPDEVIIDGRADRVCCAIVAKGDLSLDAAALLPACF